MTLDPELVPPRDRWSITPELYLNGSHFLEFASKYAAPLEKHFKSLVTLLSFFHFRPGDFYLHETDHPSLAGVNAYRVHYREVEVEASLWNKAEAAANARRGAMVATLPQKDIDDAKSGAVSDFAAPVQWRDGSGNKLPDEEMHVHHAGYVRFCVLGVGGSNVLLLQQYLTMFML